VYHNSSNWQAPKLEGLGAKLEGLGADEDDLRAEEADMEDDAFMEDDPDKASPPPPVPWRLMARYLGQLLEHLQP
jgi:hypothetical protein